MTVQLGGINVNMGVNLGPLQAGLNSAKGLLGGFGVAAVGAMVGFGVASVQAAGQFQSSLTSLQTGAGESAANLKMVGDGILNLSTATGTSTKQLTDGMYMIESAGQHGAAGLNVLKIAAEGAKVGNADLGVTANALTTIITDYHQPASQAAADMNALTATVASGKTNLQDLAGSMGAVLPLASSLGISFPQVGGAIATMTNQGMPAQQASQNLANAIRSLSAPGGVAVKSMKDVGLSAQQLHNVLSTQGLTGALQLIEDHVGKKFPAGSVASVKAFEDIMGGATGYNVALMVGGKNMETFKGNVDNITGAMKKGGDTVTGWSQVQGNFNQQMSQLGAAVNVVEIKLGSMLLPVLTKLVETVVPIISDFSGWLDKSNGLASGLDYLSRVLQIFVVPAFHATHMITKTVTDFFQGVADTTSAVTKPSFAQLGETVNTTLNPAMNDLSMLFQLTAQQLPDLTGVTTLQKQAFDALSTTTGPLGQSLGQVNNASTLLGQVFGGVLNSGIQVAISGMHAFADFESGPVTRAQQALVDWLGQTGQAYGGLAQAAIAAMGKLANLKMPSLGQISTGGINLGKMLFGDMQSIVPAITASIMAALGQVAGQLMGKLAGIFAPLGNALKGVLDPLFGFLTAGWQKVVALWNAATAPLVAAWNQIMSAIRPFVAFWQTYIAPIFAEWVARGTPLLKKFIGDVGGIFNDMMNQLRPIFATLGPWFQNTLMPAIKSVLPSIQHFGDAFMEYAFPVVTAIIRVVSSLVVLLVSIVVPLFEAVAPRAIKLFGVALDGATKVLIFMKPYVLQALDAVNQFVQWLATNAKPTIDSIFKWLDGVVAGFASLWRTYWPEITLVAEGAWNVIVGSIRGAWLIITGIIKIALDLIQGNWGAAWNDLISTLQGLGGVLIQITTGLFQILEGVVVGALLGVTNYFIKTGNDIGTVMSQVWSLLVVDAQTAWQLFWQGLNQFFGGLPDKMVAIGKSIMQGLLNGLESMFAPIFDAVDHVTGFISNAIASIPRGDIHPAKNPFAPPGFASGVQNFSGGLAMVGENGPELVNLPHGSSVYPLQGSSSSGGGTSQGNGDQHIYIMFDGNEMAHYIGKKQQKLIHLHTGIK